MVLLDLVNPEMLALALVVDKINIYHGPTMLTLKGIR